MPLAGEIGDVVQTRAEAVIEWKIKDFFSLSEQEDDCYSSPVFGFADSYWYIVIYPNGQSKYKSAGWIDLNLARHDFGSSKCISLALGIKSPGTEKFICQRQIVKFSKNHWVASSVCKNCITRSMLAERHEQIMPTNILTIHCELSCTVPVVAKTSLFCRLRNVGRNLLSLMTEGQWTDFTLRCQDREWRAHKVILGSRSEYFDAMLRQDWQETSEREVHFSELPVEALDLVIRFIYCGEVEDLSVGNVFGIYACANLLYLVQLKAVCVEYIKRAMRADVFCDAIALAYMYDDEELKEYSLTYFAENSDAIVETKEWNHLKETNPVLVFKILEKMVQPAVVPVIVIRSNLNPSPPAAPNFGTTSPVGPSERN